MAQCDAGGRGIQPISENQHMELSAFDQPVTGVRLLGGVTFMDAELTKTVGGTPDGKKVPGVPTTTFNLYGEYDTPWIKDLTLTGRVVYGGSTLV